jgi:hypothetical protein
VSSPLAAIEAIADASGIAPEIEAMLPAGVRRRQLRVRTLIIGMLLALAGRRPAHLTEAHHALTALPEADQARLGVTADWHGRPHQLTYRQVEYAFRLVAKALGKDQPDGAPSDPLAAFCDHLLEASIPSGHKQGSRSLAADWTEWSPGPGRRPAAATAPTPKRTGGTATSTCPAPTASCSTAGTCRSPSWSATRQDPRSPSWRAA